MQSPCRTCEQEEKCNHGCEKFKTWVHNNWDRVTEPFISEEDKLRKVCRKITTGYMSEKKFNEAWGKWRGEAER